VHGGRGGTKRRAVQTLLYFKREEEANAASVEKISKAGSGPDHR